MMQYSFTFEERMIQSEEVLSNGETIAAYLLRKIPLAIRVERASRADDRRGIDYWVTLRSGRMIGVDVKVRDIDFRLKGYDDLALETWSVMEKKIIGWTANPDKQTDFILWIWKDTRRCVLLPFPWLCDIFIKNMETWRKLYKTAVQRTENSSSSQWHSECVFVPRKVVWGVIYGTFGGKIA